MLLTLLPLHRRYILFAAEEEGLELPYACRLGCCTSCTVKVKEGEMYQPQSLGLSKSLREQVWEVADWYGCGRNGRMRFGMLRVTFTVEIRTTNSPAFGLQALVLYIYYLWRCRAMR